MKKNPFIISPFLENLCTNKNELIAANPLKTPISCDERFADTNYS